MNSIRITSRGNVWIHCPFFSLETVSELPVLDEEKYSRYFQFHLHLIKMFGISLSIVINGREVK